MNKTRKSIFLNSLLASLGLIIFGFGVYMTIQANLGVAPWDAFNLGLSKTVGISYGLASIIMSFICLGIDILLKEKIGIGMILDAVLVGVSVDVYNWIGIIPAQTKLVFQLLLMLGGLIIMGFAVFLYMKAGLGCGPRDTMLVGLDRKLKKVPIGVISVCILAIVTLIGWLLGGPIGVGTLICAGLTGPIMQLIFILVKFVPTDVEHQDIITSVKIIIGKKK